MAQKENFSMTENLWDISLQKNDCQLFFFLLMNSLNYSKSNVLTFLSNTIKIAEASMGRFDVMDNVVQKPSISINDVEQNRNPTILDQNKQLGSNKMPMDSKNAQKGANVSKWSRRMSFSKRLSSHQNQSESTHFVAQDIDDRTSLIFQTLEFLNGQEHKTQPISYLVLVDVLNLKELNKRFRDLIDRAGLRLLTQLDQEHMALPSTQLLEKLIQMPNLNALVLCARDAPVLGEIGRLCPKLKQLKLLSHGGRFRNRTQSKIFSPDVPAAFRYSFTSLMHLNLHQCAFVDDRWVDPLLYGCGQLRWLALWGTSLSESGVRKLTAGLGLEHLESNQTEDTAFGISLMNSTLSSLDIVIEGQGTRAGQVFGSWAGAKFSQRVRRLALHSVGRYSFPGGNMVALCHSFPNLNNITLEGVPSHNFKDLCQTSLKKPLAVEDNGSIIFHTWQGGKEWSETQSGLSDISIESLALMANCNIKEFCLSFDLDVLDSLSPSLQDLIPPFAATSRLQVLKIINLHPIQASSFPFLLSSALKKTPLLRELTLTADHEDDLAECFNSDLGHDEVQLGDFVPMSLIHCPLLERLTLQHLTVTDSGVEFLCNLACSPLLTFLDLKGCHKLSDHSLDIIASRCPKLHHLGLSGVSKITDLGLYTLHKLCLLKTLVVAMEKQHRFGSVGLCILKMFLPELRLYDNSQTYGENLLHENLELPTVTLPAPKNKLPSNDEATQTALSS